MTAPAQPVGREHVQPALMLVTVLAALVLAGGILAFGENAVYAVVAVIAFAVFLRYPVLGLYATTVLLLLSGSATIVGDLRLSVPLTGAKVCGFAAFTAWAMNALARGERIRFTMPVAILVVFLLSAGVGIAMSPAWELQWAEWVRLATLIVYFFLAINVLDTPQRIRVFIILILVCGLFMALFAVAQYFLDPLQLELATAEADIGIRTEGAYVETGTLASGPAVRVSGGAGHSNWLAMVILVIMPLNTYWFMTARRKSVKALALTTVALEIVALILTFTRTGFLVGVILLAILGLRHLVRFTPERVVAVLLAIFLAWFVLPEPYKERVLTVSQYTASDSVVNRMELQEAAWRQWTTHPVFGVGLGGYGPRLLDDNSKVAVTMRWFVDRFNWPPQFIGPHNMYLQIGSETGIIGLFLFLMFFFVLLRELRKAHIHFTNVGDKDGAALASCIEVSLIAFLICAVFLHALQQKIWWMVAAMAAVVPLYQMSIAEYRAKRPKDESQ